MFADVQYRLSKFSYFYEGYSTAVKQAGNAITSQAPSNFALRDICKKNMYKEKSHGKSRNILIESKT